MKTKKVNNRSSRQQRVTKRGQLFSNNNPDTTVHGYGFDTPEHVQAMLSDLHNRDITYQFQVVNTMHARAQEVLKRTKDPAKRALISKGIPQLKSWLDDYKRENRLQRENHVYLAVKTVNMLEPLAEYYNISRKARGLEKPTKSDEGFLKVYRRVGDKNMAKLRTLPVKASVPDGETWDKHRNNYIVRRMSMLKNAGTGYGLYHTDGELKGLPTILHVNMLMWAYTPDPELVSNPDKLNGIIKQIRKLKITK